MSAPLLVVGGSGFVGRAVCRRAVQRGVPVISLSRRGKPENLVGSWVKEVDWRIGSAFEAEGSKHLIEQCCGVISTVGIMVDSSWPSSARQFYATLKQNFQSTTSSSSTDQSNNTYEALNRDVHLKLAAEAAASACTLSFVYLSAVPPNALNSKIPYVQRYFSTKMETELALARYDPDELRCTVLRPTIMYDDENLHTLAPAALSKVSSLLDGFVFSRFGLNDVPHLLPTPPIFVDTVAESAVEAALNPMVEGILHLDDIRRVAHNAGLVKFSANSVSP